MTTPCAPNQIAMSDINVEIGRSATTANSNINETPIRTLAGIPSGQIDFNSLRCKSSYTPMSLSKSGDVFGSCFGFFNGDFCNATTSNVTISVSGGQGPYTFAWSYVSGDGATVNSPSSQTTSFTRTDSVPAIGCNNRSGTYRCTVTDATGPGPNQRTIDVVVSTQHCISI